MAANSPTLCRRAHETFGWKPTEMSFEEVVDDDVEQAIREGVGQKAVQTQPWTSDEIKRQAQIAHEALAGRVTAVT